MEKIKNKVLIVIPAYNESKNIGKVIREIKTDFKEANILVINDRSTDLTSDIAKKNGVNVIDHVANLRYAGAVQTGIKYAYEKEYEYVIQFDGDGQHIAKEAKSIYEYAIKSNADIVIGSRFLKDTGYKHPFFRKVGTKLFSFIIKAFCKKKITDPTSGLQCLNNKVMRRYSDINGYPEFPDANLIIEMLYEGYNIEEVSVTMRQSNTGQSMHGGIIKPIKYMIKILYTIIIIIIKNIGKKRR